MSGLPLSVDSTPGISQLSTNTTAAASHHSSASNPDPTLTANSNNSNNSDNHHAAQGGLAPTNAPSSTELARLKVDLKKGLRQYPDFPTPGILFEDIMPLFASHSLFTGLIRAMELQVADVFHTKLGVHSDVDVVVGLESRGFLFGPTLALRLGAGFVPVRKQGKLPGQVATETFKKEYGEDVFQMQQDAIKPGAKVVIVDDIIATGGSAAAAGNLVHRLGGNLLGYIFIMELDFLKGRDKLDAPVHTLLSGQEEALKS